MLSMHLRPPRHIISLRQKASNNSTNSNHTSKRLRPRSTKQLASNRDITNLAGVSVSLLWA